MNMAPVSSLTVGILPLSSAVKKVSGTQVRVCHDVANLKVFIHIHMSHKADTLHSFL